MMYVYIAIALVIALMVGAGTWRLQEWRHAVKELERAEALAEKTRMDAKRIDRAATSHESDKTRIKTEFVVVTKEVERVVKEPFYAGQCLDDAGLRALSNAIQPLDAAGKPKGAVPRSGPAD